MDINLLNKITAPNPGVFTGGAALRGNQEKKNKHVRAMSDGVGSRK